LTEWIFSAQRASTRLGLNDCVLGTIVAESSEAYLNLLARLRSTIAWKAYKEVVLVVPPVLDEYEEVVLVGVTLLNGLFYLR
jgi:hypothetical protein